MGGCMSKSEEPAAGAAAAGGNVAKRPAPPASSTPPAPQQPAAAKATVGSAPAIDAPADAAAELGSSGPGEQKPEPVNANLASPPPPEAAAVASPAAQVPAAALQDEKVAANGAQAPAPAAAPAAPATEPSATSPAAPAPVAAAAPAPAEPAPEAAAVEPAAPAAPAPDPPSAPGTALTDPATTAPAALPTQQQELGADSAAAGPTPAAASTATAATGDGHPHHGSNGSDGAPTLNTTSSGTSNGIAAGMGTWDKAKMLFSLMRPEELLNDLHDLKYIGAGGYGKVFKAVWRSAPVAVKLVPSHSPELFKSSSYKEALLCKELCHPNIVQTYETRCAQLNEEFVHSILSATTPPGQTNSGLHMSGNGTANTTSYGSQEFVSGDGFGLPSPVPDMVVRGRTLPEAAAKWKDILFTTGAKANDHLTVIIMDFCDYGSLVRPIVKGMFRPFSASGSDREARVRYRALLRTAKEIAQGLEHLHYLRVVHGDLKPGNVLLKGSRVDVRGFNAQVIDFGLSHMVNNSNPQRVSKAGGTLVYAAPEVFSGVVGKAADVYSLGIILWEMVTGSQPYKDLNEGQIVLGVQKNGLRPAWPPGQLPQLQELYEKCVAQDADRRPKAKEVVQFLTQIEMDLRTELRAAHKRQQQAQQQQMQPPPPPPVQQQVVQQQAGRPVGGAAGADQAQLLAANQQAMAAMQHAQAQQQQVQ